MVKINACSLPYENDIHLKLTWILQISKTSSSCRIHVFFQDCIIHVATWILQISQHEFYNTGNMNSIIRVGASSLQLYIFSADRSYSWIHLSREIQSFEFWDVACFFWKSWFDSLVICNQNRSCFLSEAQVKHLKLSVDCCGVITKYLIPVTAPKNKSSGWTQTPGAPCILWHKKFNHFGIWQK